ncbi:cardiolipin synthase [Luteimonas sp. 50]|uniref:Cardiolipin synthase n=1 Tax=Cognatiluteimonas sedimenti TaxID=2927791 RepID=A0ABT0A5Q6_9GAMM|nr:cardiolipin synthase [Lysobacter sedimenti]MCJ0826281.1 cardiolipin synthase [Lysobacter sedimenti]
MLDPVHDLWRWLLSVPHLGLYLAAGWFAYLVLLGGWIVLQKRAPVATLGWLLGLAALPYAGFLVYLVLGPQRIKRHRLRRARAHVALPPAGATAAGGEPAELMVLAQATTGLPLTTARDVRLLVDGATTYDAILDAVRQARQHVHLEYYIFAADRSGTALRDALVERARAGIAVRLLLDAVGSGATPRRFFAPLQDAGGEVAWFHPMRFGRIWKRTWLNLRSHRKIVVVDGHVAFTGGINITDEENERLRPDAYRDLHLRIEGDAVRALQLLFVEDWAYASGQRDFISSVAQAMPPPQPGPIAAQVLGSGPDSPWEAIHRLHVGAIHAASRRVWLVTPYFVPGEAAMMALTSAALGGLDVRILVPRRSDSLLVTWAARSYFDDLIAAGARVYEYGPRMLHTKALLVDDALAIVGSANFDPRSFRLNFEVSVLFRDAGIAAALAHLVEGEFASAPRVRAERARPLWTVRLPEALARLLSPLL